METEVFIQKCKKSFSKIMNTIKVFMTTGADTGGVDRVDIHPPFFSKKKFEMSLYLK